MGKKDILTSFMYISPLACIYIFPFQYLTINPTHIESRTSDATPATSKSSSDDSSTEGMFDYFIEFPAPPTSVMDALISKLESVAEVVQTGGKPLGGEVWFPRHISEVRKCCTTLFKYGSELAEDHPGYGDLEYVKRRREIAKIAESYVL